MSINTYKRPRIEDWQVTFSDQDTELHQDNGNNVIVVKAIFDTYMVERILVDNRRMLSALKCLTYNLA